DGLGGADFDLAGTGGAVTIPNLDINIAGGPAVDADDGLDIGGSDVLTIGTRLGLTGGTLFTDEGTTDASVVITDDARIVRNLGVLEQIPTFGGPGIDIEYDAAVTTGAELPAVFDELQIDAAGVVVADDVDFTVNTLDFNAGAFDADVDGDDGTVITITDGGTIQIGTTAPVVTAGAGAAGSDDGEINFVGPHHLLFDAGQGAAITVDGNLWVGSPETVTVANGLTVGAGQTVTLGASRSTVDLTIGDDDVLALGAFTLSATGTVTLVTGGLTATTGTLAFIGAAPQTLVATGGLIIPSVTIANPTGVSLTGGNLTLTTLLTLASGVFDVGANILILPHGGTGVQGFLRTGVSNVFGAIRKFIDSVPPVVVKAPADRVEYPGGTQGGDYRPSSFTFNNPNEISGGAGTLSLTITHVESSPGGNNNLPLITTDNLGKAELIIARYPAFHWLAVMSATLSPSVDYDVELNAAGFTEFVGEDIERTRTIRRQAGAITNFWTLVGPTPGSNDNFAVSATNPITVVRGAVGALIFQGVFFTMGLESNMSFTNPEAVTINVGGTETTDLTPAFSGGTPPYTFTVTSSDDAVATGAEASDSLTVTGTGVGSATLTVRATDLLNDFRDATVSVTVNPALAAAAIADVTLNVGGSNATSTTDLSTIFTGGSAPVTYVVTTSDAAVATGAEASGTLTVTAVGAGSATITVVGTDATGATATATVNVTVNAALAGSAIPAQELKEGESITPLDLSTVFSGGDGNYTYAVSTDATHIDASESGGVLTATVVEAYAGGTTIGVVDIDVVATDGIGDSVLATLEIDVLPAPGDLDGSGGPSPASASITLDFFLGLTNLTDKQVVAADMNGDGVVTPFDAALNFAAFFSKDEVSAMVAGYLAFGEVVQDGALIEIPIQVTGGNLDEVVSASFTAQIDPEVAKVQGIESNLSEGWIVKHTVDETGLLKIAIAGYGDMTSDGTIATIKLQLVNRGGDLTVSAEGAVNDNPIAKLDELEIVELPETFKLQGNYPNPFNPTTTVQFDLPESAEVEIQIFDLLGRRAMVIPAQSIQAGVNRSIFVNASALASGSYFYRVIAKMDSKTLVESGRMMLIK
ncbi:MAG: T9SS type A sorting domain-containing protein, partial [Bacteroidetes bacterium]|nr:T9SS type A sorting domain-containing protein [Bacteroidota bacterium]